MHSCIDRGMETIGLSIYRARLARDMSQEALAAAAGVTQSTISRIESGQIPSAVVLRAIADALDMPIDLLIPPPRKTRRRRRAA